MPGNLKSNNGEAMIKVTRGEGVPYDAPQHHGVYGVLKYTKEQTKGTIVNYSYFLPSGGAEMSAAPVERTYIVMTGSVTVTTPDDSETHVLNKGDMLYIAPGEEREITVNNGLAAELIVIVNA